MNRIALLSLACLAALFGTLDAARAGLGSITYDWVTPSGGLSSGTTTGVYVTGSITVDSTGISATPIDLTVAMVQSWHVSVFDSTNTLLFSMAPPTADIGMTPSTSPNFEAPKITSTSIYLPALPSGNLGSVFSDLELDEQTAFAPFVFWVSSVNFDAPTFDTPTLNGVFASPDDTTLFVGGDPTSNSDRLVATAIPEPGGLAIASLGIASAWVGAGRIGRRRRLSVGEA